MLFDPNLFDKDSDGQITHKCSFDRPAFQSIDISSGIVVGEWSMDFTLYPKPEDIKGEVLEGLQKVALSEMEVCTRILYSVYLYLVFQVFCGYSMCTCIQVIEICIPSMS